MFRLAEEFPQGHYRIAGCVFLVVLKFSWLSGEVGSSQPKIISLFQRKDVICLFISVIFF